MSRSTILMNSVNEFYARESNRELLLNILHKRDKISLRNIEWFVSNYAKKHNVAFKTRDGKNFAVHVNYKSSLAGFSKKLFDPFCRTEKIPYTVPGSDVVVHTTLAQLNFVRWVIKSGIYDYIEANRSALFTK